MKNTIKNTITPETENIIEEKHNLQEIVPDYIEVDGKQYKRYQIILYNFYGSDIKATPITTYLSLDEAYDCEKNLEDKITKLVNTNMPIPISFTYRNRYNEIISYATIDVVAINHNIPINLVKIPDVE